MSPEHGRKKGKTSRIEPEYEALSDVLLDDKLHEPPLYKVLLYNDNYTTMEFVVGVLMDIFRKNAEEATAIMLAVHKSGLGLCGVYPLEIAETKVMQVRKRARGFGFPLRCTLEEAE